LKKFSHNSEALKTPNKSQKIPKKFQKISKIPKITKILEYPKTHWLDYKFGY